ncbi:MAG: hypothetical protein LBC18_06835 [Opitutaceae bacterium]|nr:hypothetical protein [Opitutaceae bacterium]
MPAHNAVSAKECKMSGAGTALLLVRATGRVPASSSKTPARRTNATHGTSPPQGVSVPPPTRNATCPPSVANIKSSSKSPSPSGQISSSASVLI